MSWTIVEFLETQEVEAVPSKWLLQSQCYWPTLDAQKIVAEIKKCAEPNTCWPRFDVRIFKNGTYDNYMMARSKAKRAEATSEFASEEDRLRKRKKDYIYSSSDEESVLPTPPRFKQMDRINNDAKIDGFAENQENVTHTPTKNLSASSVTPSVTPVSISSNRHKTEPGISLSNKNCNGSHCNCCKDQQNRIEKIMQEVVDGQKSLRAQVLQLREDIKDSSPNMNSREPSFFDNFSCPVRTLVELNLIEEYLESPENKQKAIQDLSRIGGRNIYDCVKRILSNLITNPLAQQFSYHGAKGKTPFKELKFNGLIMESLTTRKDFDRNGVEVATMKWLRRAKERK